MAPDRSRRVRLWTQLAPLALSSLAAAQQVDYLPRGKPTSLGFERALPERVEGVVRPLVETGQLPGAVVVVARKGKVACEVCVGHRDLETKEAITVDTVFRVHSLTKPVVCAAVMILVERRLLKLRDPVSKHLPVFADVRVHVRGVGDEMVTEAPARAMTVEDLMRHTSGLVYGKVGEGVVERIVKDAAIMSRADLAAAVDALAELPLAFSPGTSWRYGHSHVVLGRIIEVVAGKPLDRALQTLVFDPLGMDDTGFHVRPDQRARFASSYRMKSNGSLEVADARDDSKYLEPPAIFSPGGGLVSTPADYARFCQMLLGGGKFGRVRLLKAKSVRAMTQNQLPEEAFPIRFDKPSKGVGFGYGMSVAVRAPHRPAGEYAWSGFATTHFWADPKERMFALAFTQLQPSSQILVKPLRPLIYDALR